MSEEEPTRPVTWIPPYSVTHPRTFPDAESRPRPVPLTDLIPSHRRPSGRTWVAVLMLATAIGLSALIYDGDPPSRSATPGAFPLPVVPVVSAVPYLPPEPASMPPSPARTTAVERSPVATRTRRPAPSRTATTRPPVVSPVARLRAGAVVGLEPVHQAGHRLRHRDFLARIDPVGRDSPAVDRADARFVVRPGLADRRCVSFEAVNLSRHFLRHQDFRLKLHPADGTALFAADATFCPDGSDQAVRLRSVNYPDRFLAARRSQVRLLPAEYRPITFAVRSPY
jgi:Alpha-L-arabinofuranosidase B (ABFB) domain